MNHFTPTITLNYKSLCNAHCTSVYFIYFHEPMTSRCVIFRVKALEQYLCSKKKKEKHIYFHMALLIIQHVVHVHWSSLHFYGLNQICDYFKMRRFLLLTVSCTDNRTFQIKVCRESPSVWPLTKSNFSLTQHCIYGMIFAHLQCLYIELMLTAFKVHTVS